jgi:hypothetical protein
VAKWISDSVIAASGKLGGTVLSKTLHNMTMRSLAVPAGSAASAKRVPALNAATAAALWPQVYRTDNVWWELQASWLTYASTTGADTFVAPFPFYAAAYANSQTIGSTLIAQPTPVQTTITTIGGYEISGLLDLMELNVFGAGGLPWENAFVLGALLYGVTKESALPATGYTMLGGNAQGYSYTFGYDLRQAMGKAPVSGEYLALAIYPLNALNLTPAQGLITGPPLQVYPQKPTIFRYQVP